MLIQICIRDFATIESLELNLPNGTTMITGETGAGKSIFIEAIDLALGGRASANNIRPGKEKADISLSFEITQFPHVISRLQEYDLYLDNNECIIRRIISNDGRSRCYVNNTPATVQFVKELGELLFHLHSQHEQQILIKADKQREMLDRFADHLPLAQAVKQYAEEWKNLSLHIQHLQEKNQARSQHLNYLSFQLEELNSLQLKDNEWEDLEIEHKRLSHHEELVARLGSVLARLNGQNEENPQALRHIQEIHKILESIIPFEPKAENWLNITHSILLQLKDLESELQNYLDKTELDPEKMRVLEERLSLIFDLARKYKVLPQKLNDYIHEVRTEYQLLCNSDENLLQLQAQLAKVANAYFKHASQLSASRKAAALKLEKLITQTIRSLSLPYAEFKIILEATSSQDIHVQGQEKITFLIKTNPDQSLQPLAKVISGGELSRLSLALHLALANKTNIPILIFDEVDTGLSGATAEKIGKLLQTLGKSYQVFCITHQAQVAACGQHHLLVEKNIVKQTTYTQMRLLSKMEKTKEIARLLGGTKITAATLAHAEELLE